jgi:hypothetical protein
MSDKTLKQVKCITDEHFYVTKGCVYTVLSTNEEHLRLICDDGDCVTYHKDGFVDVQEANKVETKQYYEQRTGLVYDLVFQGERLTILKAVLSGSEVVVDIENLENTYHFIPYTKAMQKQAKHKEDLGTLANVTDEIRKLLDDNHVICHAKINRDTKGLVEFSLMLGEVV